MAFMNTKCMGEWYADNGIMTPCHNEAEYFYYLSEKWGFRIYCRSHDHEHNFTSKFEITKNEFLVYQIMES